MANEITVVQTIRYSKNGISLNRTITKQITQTGNPYSAGVQNIGTTHELLVFGDVATPGITQLLNTDSTNYVEIGIVTGGVFYPLTKLKAGEPQQFRFGTTAPYAKANTGAVLLEFTIFDD